MSSRFERFTKRGQMVLTLARKEARNTNFNYIGTEHILLGILSDSDSAGAMVLKSFGVSLPKIRSAIEFVIGRGDKKVNGEIGLTPRAKRVIELAIDEANRFGDRYIGTQHILLGILKEGGGVAACVLDSFAITLEGARKSTIEVLQKERAKKGTVNLKYTDITLQSSQYIDLTLQDFQNRNK